MVETELLSTSQVAKHLFVSEQTIREWEKKKILQPMYKLPSGKRLYTDYQIKDFLQKMKNQEVLDVYESNSIF